MDPIVLHTSRLELILASAAPVRAAADGDLARLGELLGAAVAPDWPPDYVSDALPRVAKELERCPLDHGFGMYFVVLKQPRVLIGTGGLKSPPQDGRVDVGYSIVAAHQRKGLATEATRGLIEYAFSNPAVERVVAETMPELTPSIRVLEKLGFRLRAKSVTGFSGEENVIQYELMRPAAAARM